MTFGHLVLLASESPENTKTPLKCAMQWWDYRSICCQGPQNRDPICPGARLWPFMAETPRSEICEPAQAYQVMS